MIKHLKLLHLRHLPRDLEGGILYVSKEFGTAGHLCPCGCGSKVITPLGRGEWSFREKNGKPTLRPSIGNWQLPCRSHYFVTNGAIVWSEQQWTDEEIKKGQERETDRREAFYANQLRKKKTSTIRKVLSWIKSRT